MSPEKPWTDGKNVYLDYLTSLSAFRATSLVALMASCVRLHLNQDPALWIAMAPAYAFAGVWCVFLHPCLNAAALTIAWYVVSF